MASSVAHLSPRHAKRMPLSMLIKSRRQFLDAIENFEHPTDNPELKHAYSMAIADVKALISDCCICFTED